MQENTKIQSQERSTNTDKSTSTTSGFLNRLLLKIKYSFYSALVFFVFANPETFRILQTYLGKFISFTDSAGVPTPIGFFINAGLFFLTMLGLMLLPS